jgi:hypothetical protein
LALLSAWRKLANCFGPPLYPLLSDFNGHGLPRYFTVKSTQLCLHKHLISFVQQTSSEKTIKRHRNLFEVDGHTLQGNYIIIALDALPNKLFATCKFYKPRIVV